MTEPRVDGKAKSAWLRLKPALGWLNQSVSWKVIIAVLAGIGLAMAMFVVAGGINVSADRPDSWAATNGLHFVFRRNIGSRASGVVPPSDIAAPSRVRLAAQHFDMVCANCHGRPGFGQSVVALSMSPRPQYLPKVVGQFKDAELYLIVQHGVKYSAMPSWATAARSDEVWSMVAFLRRLPTLDAATYREMTALPETAAAPSGPSGGDTALRPANAHNNAPPTNEFLYAAPAAGFSDQTVHDNPAATCARCHGADGSGAVTGGEAPNLTIQDAAYLRSALQAYTSGARKSGFMQNVAAQLSGPQIAVLSDYYAGLPVRTVSSPGVDPALVKRGEAIATQGIRERATPACALCHESAGAAITGAPHIAGQSTIFLRRQLLALRHGDRGSTVLWNPMPAEAHALEDKDIDALAAYYSGLKSVKAGGGGQTAASSQAIRSVSDVAGDMSAAKAIFEIRCVTCHLDHGRGDQADGYPNLTIQATPYVAQSLYAFSTRARPSVKMHEVVDSLSFDQMASLAKYVNGLTPRPALTKPDPAAALRGASIASQGVPARGVPACLNCHGAKGIAALPLIPHLQGQSVLYLRNRLDTFAKPYSAKLSALNPMPSIASPLTAGERADLAAYFAAAAPLAKP